MMKGNRRFLKDIPYIVAVALLVVAAAIFGFIYNGNKIAVDNKDGGAVSSGAEVVDAAPADKAAANVEDVAANDGSAEVAEPEASPVVDQPVDQSAEQKQPSNQSSDKNSSVASDSKEEFISRADAKKKALAHAGLKEADIREYEIELDRDRNVVVYEIDFKSGRFEYSYDINARNGKIVKSEKENYD